MLEVEIKARCAEHDDVASKIIELGGRMIEAVVEDDAYFNHPSRDFKETDEALRIRRSGRDNVLTYKGPKLSKIAKTRFECESGFENFDNMREILLRLGFIESGFVRKHRTMYELDGITICLDDVEKAGKFVELEKQGEKKDEIEAELFALAEKLSLTEFEQRSYLHLVLMNK